MGKYNITRKDLKEKLQLLMEYYPEQEDDINLINSLIINLKTNFKTHESFEEISSTLALKEDLKDFKFFLPYYKYVKLFLKRSIILTDAYYPRYKKLDISDEEAVCLNHDFFKEQGKFYYDAFCEYYTDMEDHLKFIKPSKYSSGLMYYLKTFDEAFAFIPSWRNITKVTILMHEIEHILDIINRSDEFIKQSLISESSALFMEMIGCDWISQKIKCQKDNLKRRLQIHTTVKNDSDNIYLKNQLLALIKKHKSLCDDELIKTLDNYGFEEHNIDLFAKYSLFSDYAYQVSYFIALELYCLYQNDKEKALYILKYIILYGTNDNIFEILNKFNITLNSNVRHYEEDLCYALVKR